MRGRAKIEGGVAKNTDETFWGEKNLGCDTYAQILDSLWDRVSKKN